MVRSQRIPMIIGDARFESALFSNRWDLRTGNEVAASLVRDGTRHISTARLADGTAVEFAPEAWGVVVAASEGEEWGRIERTSWWGRSWDLTSRGFACELVSDRLPRRWSVRLGSQPVGRLAGGAVSYNHLDVHTDIGIPITALILCWHVLARPWEQAAAPGSLIRR